MTATRHRALVWIALMVFLCAQIASSRLLQPLRPAIEEMPFPLNDLGVKGLALGDEQFLFRLLARWLQEVGDGGGRVRSLKDYDYDRVVGWLATLDRLDGDSDYSYLLAAHYFGAIGDPAAAPEKIRKIVDYFLKTGLADPVRYWPRLVWAATRAQHMVQDKPLMMAIARQLAALRERTDTPAWLPLLAPPLYRAAGDPAAADALERDPKMMAVRKKGWDDLRAAMGWPDTQ